MKEKLASAKKNSRGNPSGWWRRQTYDYCSYYLDGDGIIQKIYHDPDVEESNAEVQCRRTRGRAKTPPPQKGALKKTNSQSVISLLCEVLYRRLLGLAKEADRGSTPVSFKPQARPPKYFLRGNPRTNDITNESNTKDGGYQIWVWCSHERRGQELWWRPVDLENEQFVHPKIATRSLKLTSTGKPSWVLNSTLTTYRTRSTRRSRSLPATGSGFTPEAESVSAAK
ncbi:hypothetical protein GG344DRAFT_68943 [Lentinula edodes]|nr:hypothetical protein GG344DRAFT_68943 [Lentinula edodes]